MYRKKRVLFTIPLILFITGCATTVDVEKTKTNKFETVKESSLIDDDDMTDGEYVMQQLLKEKEELSSVVYIEEPQTIYGDETEETPVMEGAEALKQHLKDVTEIPKYSDNRLRAWSYKKGHVYQLHCQTYHTTIIQLEPGEEVLETPYISEADVWRMSYGFGKENGVSVPLFFIKPDYSGLTSTLSIVTDRRVYMLELKSYKDHYMPYVQWVYPSQTPEGRQSLAEWENTKRIIEEYTGENAENLSFDYKIKSSRNKPVWIPVLVYDDGRKTFIVLDKKSLHMTIPTVFKGKREIVNKEVRKNIIVINELIEKVTLREGKEKVTITKKKSRR